MENFIEKNDTTIINDDLINYIQVTVVREDDAGVGEKEDDTKTEIQKLNDVVERLRISNLNQNAAIKTMSDEMIQLKNRMGKLEIQCLVAQIDLKIEITQVK